MKKNRNMNFFVEMSAGFGPLFTLIVTGVDLGAGAVFVVIHMALYCLILMSDNT